MLRIQETQMIEINLNAPTTPEEQQMNIAGNISLGRGEKSVPYMDHEGVDEDQIVAQQQKLSSWAPTVIEDDGKPHLRFYAVGPNTYQIRCPLCKNRADTETVTMSGILGKLSCLMSCLSCCFPIFSLSFVYLCLQSRLKSKRLFCNSCGGHLGFFWRPT